MTTLANEFDRAFRLHQQGKLREAFMRYDAILKADPKHAAALHYSGVVLHQSGNHWGAVERIRASIAIDGASSDAWSNLAMALHAGGRPEAAINALKAAAELAPQSPEVLANLAAAQVGAGLATEGEASARQAIAVDATHANAWYNLALALEPQGRMLEALDAAGRAAGMAPSEARYAGYKAHLEDAAGAQDKAMATLESALARHPGSYMLRFELANLQERHGDLPAAARSYEQVLSVQPQHGPALSQLIFTRARMAEWRDRERLVKTLRAEVAAGTSQISPFVLLALPSSRAEQRKCAEDWARSMGGAPGDRARTPISVARLRIGYLSADFHSHATAFLAAGLFERHDRSRFEVVAYSTGPDDRSPMRQRLQRAFDRFVDLQGREPAAIADAIRADRIDILVDLKGHTEGASPIVLARRPAPIQVHYLGYPGTLGGGLVDYLIGDSVVTPIEHGADYAETLVLLPHSYQVNDRQRPVNAPPTRAELGLPDAGIVFCNFNQHFKINGQVFDAWSKILKAVPQSVLWLLARGEDDPALANLRREAAARGIDVARLVFAQYRPNEDYLGLYRQADLFLDTWPYNAHTTASDSLWAGCPVLTTMGTTFAGRVASSLLTAVGLPQLVCATVDDYIASAVQIAKDSAERRRLKGHLAGPGHASPLFDTEQTTRALEAAYAAMAEQYRQGVRRSFRVEAIPDDA
jgi:predicted O-linked N-acetylglucosamine transferase (SPINDLY family)